MGRLKSKNVVGYVQVALSAALTWASFPETSLWFLLPPALALLIAAVDQVGTGRGAWYGFLWGLGFFLPHIWWAVIAVDGNPGPWAALALSQAAFMAVWGGGFAASKIWTWRQTWWGEAIIAAFLWVGIEQLRSRIPFGGFGWGKLAYSQVDSPLIVLAPIGGEVLVSFALVFLAAILRFAFTADKTSLVRRAVFAGAFAIAMTLPLAVTLPVRSEAGTLTVAVIQGNVEVPHMTTFGIEGKVTGNHLAETKRMMENKSASFGKEPLDIVLWGENSLDRNPQTNKLVGQMVNEASAIVEVPLMAGFIEYEGDVRYNWMGIWYPKEGLHSQKYGKQYPVPWGEYVPFRSLSEAVAPEAAQIGTDMVGIDNPPMLPVSLNDGRIVKIAMATCFEASIEPVFLDGIRLGGEIIVVPTNNSQFQDSAESTQQLQMAQFRAAETGRAAVQVSTNGVSALINPNGKVIAVTGKQEAANLVGKLPLRTSISPAVIVAEPSARACAILSVVFVVATMGFGLAKRPRKK